MFACDWLQIGGDNAAIGGIIAVTWEVFGPLWHAMCHLWSAIFFWLMTGLRRRAEICARKTGPGVECGQMIWWLMRQLEVWRMTHLMVDAFKAGGQPIKPHQLWGEITEMEIKYSQLSQKLFWQHCLTSVENCVIPPQHLPNNRHPEVPLLLRTLHRYQSDVEQYYIGTPFIIFYWPW